MSAMEKLLTRLQADGGSDLHLAAGLPPRMRMKGSLEAVEGWKAVDQDALQTLLREIASDEQWEDFEEEKDLDFAYGIPGVARFRANYFHQERGVGAVFRVIPEEILSLEALRLPTSIERFAHLDRGLVLVTGPTGSGKSTTLAAIIDKINETYAKHIVTIEDPVEFVHPNKMSVFSHREVGEHTSAFGPALRGALRQDADVVLVGEMRDYETISLALTAAEMGSLVFGTLHTNSAAKTIDRVVDAFPADEQPQARLSLSESLAGVVSQLLLRSADGTGRCAANEILIRTPALANVIREGNTPMLASILQAGRQDGMQTMDDALWALVQEGRIDPGDAYLKASEKTRFEALVDAAQG